VKILQNNDRENEPKLLDEDLIINYEFSFNDFILDNLPFTDKFISNEYKKMNEIIDEKFSIENIINEYYS
jgi:hypothetical protein